MRSETFEEFAIPAFAGTTPEATGAKPRRLLVVTLFAVLLAACSGKEDGPAQKVEASKEQIARGLAVAQAGDCAACHTAEGGAPFAGGVPLATPFGTIHGTNITPDPDTGIGRWSADEFHRALTEGKARDGRHLYPAMPYTSYGGIAREDSDALYAYLMTRTPVRQANRANDLGFPYNLRFGLAFWNWMYLGREAKPASSGNSAQWQRGRYLVDVLGHCGECHTPRGGMGQLDHERPLAGAALGRIAAPDITPQGLAARGWSSDALIGFLRTGIAEPGSAYGEMFPVIHLSTQHMPDADLAAMTSYLLGEPAAAAQPVRAVAADPAALEPGRGHYLALCAGCHGREGEGKPHVAVAMAGNSTLRNVDARNLIVSVLDGLPAQDFPGIERMQDMPGFSDQLDDGSVAQLANYVRATWGGQPADVDAAAVKALRVQ